MVTTGVPRPGGSKRIVIRMIQGRQITQSREREIYMLSSTQYRYWGERERGVIREIYIKYIYQREKRDERDIYIIKNAIPIYYSDDGW